jgi:hypothetical protein
MTECRLLIDVCIYRSFVLSAPIYKRFVESDWLVDKN